MKISLKTIHTLQQFQDVLGKDPQVKYISGKGRKVNGYTLNQLSFKLSKLKPKNLSGEEGEVFQELKGKLSVLNQQSLNHLVRKRPKCEAMIVKVRQAIGNWWFKLTTGFDRKKFLSSHTTPIISRPTQPSVVLPEVQLTPDHVVEYTEPFAKYQIPLPPQFGKGKTVGLTAFTLRPANLFFQSLFKDTLIQTTLPGEDLFAFNMPGNQIRDYIDQKVEKNPEGIVEFSACGVSGAVVVGEEGYAIDDLAEVYGNKVYQMSYKEIQDVLNSQKIYTSSYLPLPFYSGLKEALKKNGSPILPGSDKKTLTLLELEKEGGPIGEFIAQVGKNPEKFGFKSKIVYEGFKKWTIYEIGAMVVKTEDYYLFMDGSGKIFTREPGSKDAFRLINACGIRGIAASKRSDLAKIDLMKATFKTALAAAADGVVIFPAVGMGVWQGPPEIYWPAFLDAIIESPDCFERIFVNPGHRETAAGDHLGSKGEEFQAFLDAGLKQYQDKPEILSKLQKIKNLFAEDTDLLQLAHHLKQAFPEKTVSIFNASDPDVTLGWHVGEYTNNMPHKAPTTEEHYTAMGSNGLCFEDITRVHEDPSRLIHAG
jgi:hypothetical protein